MATFKKASLLDDFEIPEITHENIKAKLVKIARGVSTKKVSVNFENLPIEEKLTIITKDVYKALGKYKGFVNVIYTEEELNRYLEKLDGTMYLAYDTETNNSLDPLTCKLMGVCLYIPNTKPVYVPINHCHAGTDVLLENQVSESAIKEFLAKIAESGVKILMHNGKFDKRVTINTTGVDLPLYWDTMLAAQLINENDKAALKSQYSQNIDPTTATYKIEKLFRGMPYAWLPVELFGIYAAIDAYITYKLFEFQNELLSQEDTTRLRALLLDIEVPTTSVVAKMEDRGIYVDTNFAERLNTKYQTSLDGVIDKLNEYLKDFEKDIVRHQQLEELATPLNFNSQPQLSLLMYDILKIIPMAEFGRSTDKKALKALKHPFATLLLEYRHYSKIISSFTGAIPKLVSVKDNKIHASFNQMGKEENNVRTGRFSSTDPNLQQIPSKEKVIRMMFKGSTDYIEVHSENNIVDINTFDDILSVNGYVPSDSLQVGDLVKDDFEVRWEIKSITRIDELTNRFEFLKVI